jgi:hypothetical protein
MGDLSISARTCEENRSHSRIALGMDPVVDDIDPEHVAVASRMCRENVWS